MAVRAETLNNGFFFGTIFFAISGLSSAGPSGYTSIDLWGFFVFSAMLRFKVYLNDSAHFSAPRTDGRYYIGTIVGIVSWMFWGLSFLELNNLFYAYIFLILSLVMSTVWIFIEASIAGSTDNLEAWIYFNIAYIVILILLASLTSNHSKLLVILLVLLAAVDWKVSGTRSNISTSA